MGLSSEIRSGPVVGELFFPRPQRQILEFSRIGSWASWFLYIITQRLKTERKMSRRTMAQETHELHDSAVVRPILRPVVKRYVAMHRYWSAGPCGLSE